jgi:hypothetical protein
LIQIDLSSVSNANGIRTIPSTAVFSKFNDKLEIINLINLNTETTGTFFLDKAIYRIKCSACEYTGTDIEKKY